MTTDDELRELITLGDKATARPWVISGREIHDRPTRYTASGMRVGETAMRVAIIEKETDTAYIVAAANLAPDIARELIEARERVAKLEGIVNGFLTEFENFPEGERAIVDKAREIMKGGDV